MPTTDDFLKAVLAEPERDDLRLIYADWLEEHGHPEHGEFIRLQIAIEAAKEHCSCRSCVKRRGGGQHTNGPCAADQLRIEVKGGYKSARWLQEKLWLAYGSKWLGEPLDRLTTLHNGRLLTVTWVRRGFVESISTDTATWIFHADVLLQQHPIREVTFFDWPTWEYGHRLGSACLHGRERFHSLRGLVGLLNVANRLMKAEWPTIATWRFPE